MMQPATGSTVTESYLLCSDGLAMPRGLGSCWTYMGRGKACQAVQQVTGCVAPVSRTFPLDPANQQSASASSGRINNNLEKESIEQRTPKMYRYRPITLQILCTQLLHKVNHRCTVAKINLLTGVNERAFVI